MLTLIINMSLPVKLLSALFSDMVKRVYMLEFECSLIPHHTTKMCFKLGISNLGRRPKSVVINMLCSSPQIHTTQHPNG